MVMFYGVNRLAMVVVIVVATVILKVGLGVQKRMTLKNQIKRLLIAKLLANKRRDLLCQCI